MAFRALYSKWLSRDNDENRGQGTVIGKNFLAKLRTNEVISRDEADQINKGRDTSHENVLLFLDILPGKGERGLINVIAVLQQSNPSAANNLVRLSKELNVELHLNLSSEFERISNTTETLWTFPVDSVISDDTAEIVASMKAHQKESSNYVYDYWNKFGVVRTDLWKDFYNYQLEITDPHGKRLTNIRNFDSLFDQVPFKRIVVTAEAGYGKSTFVHEMVHQWSYEEGLRWSGQKFWFVFLFRLGELQPEESWETMLQRCLAPQHIETMKSLLSKDRFLEKSLFVFDGFDEVVDEKKLPQEVINLIYGYGLKIASVVVATRPSKLDRLRKVSGTWTIQLKGLTDVGLKSLLQKFSIDNSKPYGEILKCPLFATLYGIVVGDLGNSEINLCTLIDKYVKFLLARYRQTQNVRLDKKTEHLIMLQLGEAALVQFNLIHMQKPTFRVNGWVAIEWYWKKRIFQMPNFRQSCSATFDAAKCAGLIHQTSTYNNLFFPHAVFASYLGAYFLSSVCTLHLQTGYLCRFADPYFYWVEDHFTYFLSYFSKSFSSDMWQNCANEFPRVSIPLLFDYDPLPKLDLDPSRFIHFPNVSSHLQNKIFEKINCCSNNQNYIGVSNLHFDENIVFKKLRQFTDLQLVDCDIRCSLEIFFHLYNVTELELSYCKLEDPSNSYQNDINSGLTFNLTHLTLDTQQTDASYRIINFVFDNCPNLQYLCIKEMDNFDFNFIHDKMVHQHNLKTLRLCSITWPEYSIRLWTLPLVLSAVQTLEFYLISWEKISGKISSNIFAAVNSDSDSIQCVRFEFCEFNHNFSIAEAIPSFNFTDDGKGTITGIRRTEASSHVKIADSNQTDMA